MNDKRKIVNFVDILDQVRCGSATQESLECLKKQGIDGTVVDKYIEFCKSGSSPVVYFLHGKLARILINKRFQLWTQNYTKLCVLMKLMRLLHHASGLKKLKKN